MTEKLKRDDRVRCVDADGRTDLTLGKEYEVLDVKGASITIANDAGLHRWFDTDRFELVPALTALEAGRTYRGAEARQAVALLRDDDDAALWFTDGSAWAGTITAAHAHALATDEKVSELYVRSLASRLPEWAQGDGWVLVKFTGSPLVGRITGDDVLDSSGRRWLCLAELVKLATYGTRLTDDQARDLGLGDL